MIHYKGGGGGAGRVVKRYELALFFRKNPESRLKGRHGSVGRGKRRRE